MKKYSLCVVGAGKWGTNHVKTLVELDALGGVVEVDSSVRNNIKNSYSDMMVFNSLEKSFEFNFDGYIVATPPSTHLKFQKSFQMGIIF